ncbi:MAG: DNA cytosine methyltransferase [Kiritimatiellia bacterium]|jgi:DNA (cytosine-5)-methyltransferase 1
MTNARLETLPKRLKAMRKTLQASATSHSSPRQRQHFISAASGQNGNTGKSEENFSVVSLFAGCGGMDLGFQGGFDFLGTHYKQNRFDIIWANEINPDACKTYRLNFGGPIVEGDIYDCMDQLPAYADVVIGGFPCQDISINGKMLGLAGKRSSLYKAIVETVSRLHPKVFVAENVGGLLMKKHEPALKTILSDFKALGYNVSYHLYHAEEYGVPQTRDRVIFVGTRSDMPEFIPPPPCTQEPLTAKDALADLESHPHDKDFSHVWSLAKASREQGNRHLIADRPGYTIRAECHGNIQFHYSLPRRISMREAARIQSFPDSFRFASGIRATERQIGNAVPPVLAWHVAQAVEAVIRGAQT